jgi:hypothetical protein
MAITKINLAVEEHPAAGASDLHGGRLVVEVSEAGSLRGQRPGLPSQVGLAEENDLARPVLELFAGAAGSRDVLVARAGEVVIDGGVLGSMFFCFFGGSESP